MIKIEQLSYKYPNGPLIQFPDFEVGAEESLLVKSQVFPITLEKPLETQNSVQSFQNNRKLTNAQILNLAL